MWGPFQWSLSVMNILLKIPGYSAGQPHMCSRPWETPKDTALHVYWAASGVCYPVLWPCLPRWLHNLDFSFEYVIYVRSVW